MRTPHGDNHDMWINPTDGKIMIQANDGGANVSQDGGRTWSTQMNQPTAEIYGVWIDEQFPYRLYGAQQDASTVIVPSLQLPGSTEPFISGPGCETGPIIPHPKNPEIVYGACKGQFGRMFMNTRQEQSYWVGGAIALRQRRKGLDPALSARVADGSHLVRLEHRLLRIAIRPSIARRRRALGKNLAGPHRESARAVAGRQRMADHARRHRRRVL